MKKSVDAEIQLLMSSKPEDVFLAGNQLLKQVGCLGYYHTSVNGLLEPPEEYSAIKIREDLKAITM